MVEEELQSQPQSSFNAILDSSRSQNVTRFDRERTARFGLNRQNRLIAKLQSSDTRLSHSRTQAYCDLSTFEVVYSPDADILDLGVVVKTDN